MNIIELINLIKTDPIKYISRRNVNVLGAFIYGWEHRNFEENVQIELLNDFIIWLQTYYGAIRNSVNWQTIIRYYSQDDYSALHNFFELWDRFLEDKKKGLFISPEQEPLPEGIIIEVSIIKTVQELIELLKPRPAMYVGIKSLTLLKAYIDGWYFRNPSAETKMELLTDNFHVFLQKYFEMDNKSSWDRIILYYYPEEDKALKAFFELWNEFLLIRNEK